MVKNEWKKYALKLKALLVAHENSVHKYSDTKGWLKISDMLKKIDTEYEDLIYEDSKMLLIKGWEDLEMLPASETHYIRVKYGCTAEIRCLSDDSLAYYLDSDAFYRSFYERASKLLQDCGFRVTLANWDEEIV